MRSYPLSFVLGGTYNWLDGKLRNQGIHSGQWTATITNDSNSFRFGLKSSEVEYNNYLKYCGYSVR